MTYWLLLISRAYVYNATIVYIHTKLYIVHVALAAWYSKHRLTKNAYVIILSECVFK